jgi:hypothetical protein
MVCTRMIEELHCDIPKRSGARGRGQVPQGNAPPQPPHPPVSLVQLLATQNELMMRMVVNEERRGAERP